MLWSTYVFFETEYLGQLYSCTYCETGVIIKIFHFNNDVSVSIQHLCPNHSKYYLCHCGTLVALVLSSAFCVPVFSLSQDLLSTRSYSVQYYPNTDWQNLSLWCTAHISIFVWLLLLDYNHLSRVQHLTICIIEKYWRYVRCFGKCLDFKYVSIYSY